MTTLDPSIRPPFDPELAPMLEVLGAMMPPRMVDTTSPPAIIAPAARYWVRLTETFLQ